MRFPLFSRRRRALEVTSRKGRALSRRPVLESLEERTVLSHAAVAPALGHAEIAAFAARAANRVQVTVPLAVTGVNFTSVSQAPSGALTFVGTASGTLLGHNFTTPVSATISAGPRRPGLGRAFVNPVVTINSGPIHLNLQGSTVDTGPISLTIAAQRGRERALVNSLGGLTSLLTPGANLSGLPAALTLAVNDPAQLANVNNLLARSTRQFGSPQLSGSPTNALTLSALPGSQNTQGLTVRLNTTSTVTVTSNQSNGAVGTSLTNLASVLGTPRPRRPLVIAAINAVLGNATTASLI